MNVELYEKLQIKRVTASFHILFLFVVAILFYYYLQSGAKKVYRKFRHFKGTTVDQRCRSITFQCSFCGASSNSFQLLPIDFEQESEIPDVNDSTFSSTDEVKLGTIIIFTILNRLL